MEPKFELVIILSKIREKLDPKFDKLEIVDFFSNFHVVQSIALQCKSICSVFFPEIAQNALCAIDCTLGAIDCTVKKWIFLNSFSLQIEILGK